MKRIPHALSLLLLLLLGLFSPLFGAEPEPSCFLYSVPALEEARLSLRRGEPQLKPALDRLVQEADKALRLQPASVMDKSLTAASGDKHDYFSYGPYWWPDPSKPKGLPYIRRDGQVNPESKKNTDDVAFAHLCLSIETLGLAYWFTGDERYADKVAVLMRVWFLDPATRMNPNLQHAQAIPGINDGRGIGLIESRHLVVVNESLALLCGSKAWTDADRMQFRAWLEAFHTWLTTSQNGRDEYASRNNHGSWYDVQTAHLALVLGKPEAAAKTLREGLLYRLAHQVEPDGAQPLELARTKSLDYSCFNLEALLFCAQLGSHVGVDWWSFRTSDGRSLQAALSYLAPYADPSLEWPKKDLHSPDRRMILGLLSAYLHHREDPSLRAVLDRHGRDRGLDERWRFLHYNRTLREVVDDTLVYSGRQYEWLLAHLPDQQGIPRTLANGRLVQVRERDWTLGFFPGSLWFLYEASGNARWRAVATRFTALLEKEQFNTRTHDVGFIMNCSYGNAYRLTGEPEYRKPLLQAAKSLVSRFSATVGCLKSWDRDPSLFKYPVIIDNMMNLELLLWAARSGGDASFRQLAVSHADTTLRNHFRPEGSCFHVVDYDPATGQVLRRLTHQGLADTSSWARGQAWALYGYTMMYRETQAPRYLEQARKVAAFLLTHPRMPADKVPYWDFDAPVSPETPRDSSAAAIMCSALFELSSMERDPARALGYASFAQAQLRSLCSPEYLAELGSNGGFLLRHATGNKPANSEVDAPLNYADYYFLEALLRCRNLLQHK